MELTVSLLPGMRQVTSQTDVAVAIDVLRATSVMATALSHGATKIITCPSVDGARDLASDHPGALLCGERDCVRVDGFDVGNSPREYSAELVADRTLVLTTTNGTAAIARCQAAKSVIAASFLNFHACLNYLEAMSNVHLVCAGTNGAITLEDTLLAGLIVTALQQRNPKLELLGDEPLLAQQSWRSWFGDRISWTQTELQDCFGRSQGGRNLIAKGYNMDLGLCASTDSQFVVPIQIASNPMTFCNGSVG